ncbi:MAG: hypothetical protein AAFR42_11625 [Cyanobacteria bacterium J06628_6]
MVASGLALLGALVAQGQNTAQRLSPESLPDWSNTELAITATLMGLMVGLFVRTKPSS